MPSPWFALFRLKAKGPVPAPGRPFPTRTTPASFSTLRQTRQHRRAPATSTPAPLKHDNPPALAGLSSPPIPSFHKAAVAAWGSWVRTHLGHGPALRDRGAAGAAAPGWELAVVRRHLLHRWLRKAVAPFLLMEKGERADGELSSGNSTGAQPVALRWPGPNACQGRDAASLPWQCPQQGPSGQQCPNAHPGCC